MTKNGKKAAVGVTFDDAKAGFKMYNVPLELKDVATVKKKFKRF
jgi:hypothetical protein